MVFRHTVGSLLILIACVLPALGQLRSNTTRMTYSISGAVRDDTDQHTMENIRVDLKQSSGGIINTTFTRGNGEFEFAGLGNGEYIVEVNVKDYEPYHEQVTVFNVSRRGLFVFLARPMTSVNINYNASISAHQLSAPRKAHDEFEKGLSLMYTKSDYRGAIVQFQRAIKDFPTYYEAYSQEGNAYMRLGEMVSAEEAMRKSIELSSGQFSEALFLIAGLLTDTNRPAEAEPFAQKGIAVDAASWRGPFELARALTALKQTEEAEKSAIQARDMKPDNPSVYLMLANIHIQRRDFSALQKDLEGYLKLNSIGPDAEQARKTLVSLQAAREQAENQARANAEEGTTSSAQGSPRMGSPGSDRDVPPPLEPDSSGLPSLPPPTPSVE